MGAISPGGTSWPRNRTYVRKEERLQRFWHDYYDSLKDYYSHLDHLDWVSYYKNHGYQINTGGPTGYLGLSGVGGGTNNNRIQFAPVFVTPTMNWATPQSNLSGAPSGPSAPPASVYGGGAGGAGYAGGSPYGGGPGGAGYGGGYPGGYGGGYPATGMSYPGASPYPMASYPSGYGYGYSPYSYPGYGSYNPYGGGGYSPYSGGYPGGASYPGPYPSGN